MNRTTERNHPALQPDSAPPLRAQSLMKARCITDRPTLFCPVETLVDDDAVFEGPSSDYPSGRCRRGSPGIVFRCCAVLVHRCKVAALRPLREHHVVECQWISAPRSARQPAVTEP